MIGYCEFSSKYPQVRIESLPREGEVFSVTFSPDEAASFFAVRYDDGHSGLWQIHGDPHRLAPLGLGLKENTFAMEHNRLIIQYTDGRAYILDLAWLQVLSGAEPLSAAELIQAACGQLFNPDLGLFDEAALKPYFPKGEEPQAC